MRTISLLPRPGANTAAVVVAVLTATALLAPGAIGKQVSAQAIACGGTRNTVQAEFDLASANQIWQRFPAMLRAPELDGETQAAHVVVFKGDVDLNGMVMSGSDNVPLVTNAVCVVLADGTLTFYDGVSRAGSAFQ